MFVLSHSFRPLCKIHGVLSNELRYFSSRVDSLIQVYSDINSNSKLQEFSKRKQEKLEYMLKENEHFQFCYELSSLQSKASLQSSFDWNKDLCTYGLINDMLVWIDKRNEEKSILRNCYLSFFASLFADRHGSILNMTQDSILSSFILSLYSGYNHVLLNPAIQKEYQSIISLNALDKQVSSDSPRPIQTILYNVPSSITIPPIPKDKNRIKEIEIQYNLQDIYDTISKAEVMLRDVQFSEDQKRIVPTERSLYMICPSLLLPYIYRHFNNTNSFSTFCTSLITPNGKATKEDLQKSDVLIRAFIEDEDDEEFEIEPSFLFDDDKKLDSDIEIEIEEVVPPSRKSQFITFPSISVPTSSLSQDVLDEDIASFINQIPGYGTYSIMLLQYCGQLADSRVKTRKKAAKEIMDILNDNEQKKLIYQIELFHPNDSVLENVLQQFNNVILLYHEQENSADSLAMPQILFSFLVLIHENESFYRKYCPTVIDILHTFLKWTFDDPNGFSSMIYVCNFALSTPTLFMICQSDLLQSVYSMLLSFIKENRLMERESELLHCIILYWTNAPFSLSRSLIRPLLDDFFSLSSRISVQSRFAYFDCLSSFIDNFPTETIGSIQRNIDVLIKIIHDLSKQRCVDNSLHSLISILTFLLKSIHSKPLHTGITQLAQQLFLSKTQGTSILDLPFNTVSLFIKAIHNSGSTEIASFCSIFHERALSFLQDIISGKNQPSSDPAMYSVLLVFSFCLDSYEHLYEDYELVCKVMDRPTVMLSTPYRNLFYHLTYQFGLHLLPQQQYQSFILHHFLSLITTSSESSIHSSTLCISDQLSWLLMTTCPKRVQKLFFTELSPHQQFQFLSSFLCDSADKTTRKTVRIFSTLLAFKKDTGYWKDWCHFTIQFLVKLAGCHSVSPVKVDDHVQCFRSSLEFFFRSLEVLTGCSIKCTSYSPHFVTFLQHYQESLQHEQYSLANLHVQQYSINNLTNDHSELYRCICNEILTLLKKRIGEILDHVEDDSIQLLTIELQLLSHMFGLAVDLVSFLSDVDLMESVQSLVERIINYLKRHTISTREGLQSLVLFLQFTCCHQSSLLSVFGSFYKDLIERMVHSSSLYLFAKPSINKVFAPKVFESSDNNDLLLFFLLHKRFLQMIFSSDELKEFVSKFIIVFDSSLCELPFRPYMRLALTHFCVDFENMIDDPSTILSNILHEKDDSDLAWLYYLQCGSFPYTPHLQPIIAGRTWIRKEVNLQLISLFYSTLTKKELLPWLYYLTNTMMLESNSYFQKKTNDCLFQLCQEESMCSLLESFVITLITKEWSKEPLNRVKLSLLTELITELSVVIPTLYSHLFCIQLFIPCTSLSSSSLFYVSDSISSVLLYNVKYSLDTTKLFDLCNRHEYICISILGYYFGLILLQDEPFLQSVLPRFLKVVDTCPFSCLMETLSEYPFLTQLKALTNMNLSHTLCMKLIRLLPFTQIHCLRNSDSLMLTGLNVSQQRFQEIHPSVVLQDALNSVFIWKHATLEMIGRFIHTILCPSSSLLSPSHLLQSLQMFDMTVHSISFFKSFLSIIQILLSDCVELFSSLMVNRFLLHRIHQFLPSSLSSDYQLLLVKILLQLLSIEEDRYSDLTIDLNGYLPLLNIIDSPEVKEVVKHSSLLSIPSLLALCSWSIIEESTRAMALAVLIQKDCHCYWKVVNSVFPPIAERMDPSLSDCIHQSTRVLLDYYANHIYAISDDDTVLLHSLLHRFLQISPQSRQLLDTKVSFHHEKPSSFNIFYLQFCNDIAHFMVDHTESDQWSSFYSILQSFMSLPVFSSIDDSFLSAYPYLHSLNTVRSHKSITVQETCMLHETQSLDVPSTQTITVSSFSSIPSFLKEVMELVMPEDTFLSDLRPLLTWIIDSNSSKPSYYEVLHSLTAVLLYEGSASPTSRQLGILLKRVFSSKTSESIQKLLLQGFNSIRSSIIYDYNNNYGVFKSNDSNLRIQSPQSRSPSQSESLFYSPFDLLLQKMNLPLDCIVQSATNLHMPLTSLLWIHSSSVLSQIDNTKVCSWNTILNYPSLLSQQEDSEEDSYESTSQFDNKRRRIMKNDSNSSFQLLNRIAVSNYLSVNNPHAALALTREDQLEQQLLIQQQTNHLGFSATYQMMEAYTSLYCQRTAEVYPTKNDSWKAYPWREFNQWIDMSELTKPSPSRAVVLESLEESFPGVLLLMEMNYPDWKVFSRFEQVLSQMLYHLVSEERIAEWSDYKQYDELLVFLQRFSLHSVPKTPLEKQLYANLAVMSLQSNSSCLEPLVELLVDQLASLQNHHVLSQSIRERERIDQEEREVYTLRYELEILRQFTKGKHHSLNPNLESLLLLELSKNLYHQGFQQLAINTMRTAENQATSTFVSSTCRLEELKLTSANEDESHKIEIIQAMCSILDNNSDERIESQNDSERIESQSVSVSDKLTQICIQKQSYCEIGGIVHDLYKRLNKYYQSTEYSQLEDTKNKISEELRELERKVRTATKTQQKSLITQIGAKRLFLKEIMDGGNDEDKIEERLATYKETAIECYLKGLIAGESQAHKAVFHFVNLWFHCFDEENINSTVGRLLESCDVKWFVPLAHQIISRVGQDHPVLNKLISRLTDCYPYHLIPYLIPVMNTHSEDDKSIRAMIVKSIITTLSSSTQTISQHYQSLFNAYYDLINIVEEKRGLPTHLPPIFMKKETLQSWKHLPILTVSLPILSPSQIQQQSHLFIRDFGSSFSVMATGITQPKRITCFSQTNKEAVQIAKKDEIRSDVVVQQLFELINGLLDEERIKNTSANKTINLRQILIRTYHIISITSQTGVLEFVPNSIPIRDYLVDNKPGSSSAHERYHRTEKSNMDILKAFAGIKQQSKEKKVELYRKITKEFTPVLHYFFLERFFSPSAWYNSTQSFISTLSVTSIVGYIVGLGDRHLRNILIDEKTGQIVHIDFGILFEKGKLLEVPEMVPFRLTREFVDCFGMEGVDGLFRQQMEYCLQLIAQNKELILTVLEVFLHDPLNSWKIQTNQRENELLEKVNTNAEQVLFKIENKIMGRDLQNTESISIKKQVDVLIKAATNENNLAVMFHGWSAWL